jgi:peptidoglycan/LPS O-acetylase OafA/YrhL
MDGRRVFTTLDALRAVAAACIVLYHLRVWFPAVRVLDHAYLAVDLFFVLSGFVLAHAYGRDVGAGLSFSRYLAVRAIRLYPLLILAAAVGLVHAAAGNLVAGRGQQTWTALGWFVLGAASIPMPAGGGPAGQFFPLNWPAWSLFFELVMSAAFWPIAARLSTLRLAMLVAAAGLALVPVALYLGEVTVKRNALFFLAGIPRAAFPFLVGMLLHRLHAARKLPDLRVAALAVCLVAFATFLVPFQRGPWNAIYDVFCIAVVYPLLVIAACERKDAPRLAALAWFGRDLSYAVYILHFPLIRLYVLAAEAFGMPARSSQPWYVAGAVGLVLAGSYAAVKAFDNPVRKRLVRLLSERPPAGEKPASDAAPRPHGQTPEDLDRQAGMATHAPAGAGASGPADRPRRDPAG